MVESVGKMIRVEEQPEPADFDAKVRKPGLRKLKSSGMADPAIWRLCLEDLHDAYNGICAYLGIRIPRGTGARSVDHFVARKSDISLAFEWSNFRLACALMNSRKNKFDDVLDPFKVDDSWFFVNQLNGSIRPASGIPDTVTKQVKDTIDRLGLDEPDCRRARIEHIDLFHTLGRKSDYLDWHSPLLAKVLLSGPATS